MGWFNFEVAAADRYATDVNGEFAARMWVDHGVLAHPGDERFGTGEELEDLLRAASMWTEAVIGSAVIATVHRSLESLEACRP